MTTTGKPLHRVGKELATHLGISERQVRADVLELIQAGHPIASSTRPPYGLFIVRTEKEKEQYANQIRSRIRELWERLRAFDRASVDALAGQLKMF
jgi:biotin operon repressor